METITNLQERIESIAMSKLERDIKEATENLRNFLTAQKGLFRTAISVKIVDDNNSYYPYLSQLFECEPIKNKIIEINLPDYIDREINSILTINLPDYYIDRKINSILNRATKDEEEEL